MHLRRVWRGGGAAVYFKAQVQKSIKLFKPEIILKCNSLHSERWGLTIANPLSW